MDGGLSLTLLIPAFVYLVWRPSPRSRHQKKAIHT